MVRPACLLMVMLVLGTARSLADADPFDPQRLERARKAPGAPDLRRPPAAAERYPVALLAFRGFVRQESRLRALLSTPDGLLLLLAPGDRIGQDHGVIRHIRPGRLHYTETVPDAGGGWRQREGSLP